jgi:hypothetical protein
VTGGSGPGQGSHKREAPTACWPADGLGSGVERREGIRVGGPPSPLLPHEDTWEMVKKEEREEEVEKEAEKEERKDGV